MNDINNQAFITVLQEICIDPDTLFFIRLFLTDYKLCIVIVSRLIQFSLREAD